MNVGRTFEFRLQRFVGSRLARPVFGGASVAAFLVAWELVGANNVIRSDLISYPTEIVSATAKLAASGELWANVNVSLQAFAAGFGPAVVVGIALGVLLALNRTLRELVDPLFAALYSAPLIAFVPIAVVWFGVGLASKIAMVFLTGLISIVINTMTGVQEAYEPAVRALRAFGATRWQVIWKAVLPGALPAVMAGIRLGVGRGIVSLVAAEMYVSMFGLGRLIQVYSTSNRSAEIYVCVVLVAAFGLLCVTLLRWLENVLAPWRPST